MAEDYYYACVGSSYCTVCLLNVWKNCNWSSAVCVCPCVHLEVVFLGACVFPVGPPPSIFPLSSYSDLREAIKAGLPATPASPGSLC